MPIKKGKDYFQYGDSGKKYYFSTEKGKKEAYMKAFKQGYAIQLSQLKELMKDYEIKVSKKKNKKYDVFKNGKYLLSFGGDPKKYEHYLDKLGHYSELDHMDEERRKNYYARHHPDVKTPEEAIMNTPIDSAKFFSTLILW